jgi:hypothetical protein
MIVGEISVRCVGGDGNFMKGEAVLDCWVRNTTTF